MNWKKLCVYSILILMLVIPLMASFVLAAEDWLVYSKFYTTVSPYLVPGGMEGLRGLIVGIVTIVILFAIFVDILSIVAPFSKPVIWIMAIGLGIIGITVKLNVTVAGWIFKIGAIVFAWAGAAAGFLTIILAVAIMIFIFFGGQWIRTWALRVRERREEVDREVRARRRGSQVAGGVTQAAVGLGEKPA